MGCLRLEIWKMQYYGLFVTGVFFAEGILACTEQATNNSYSSKTIYQQRQLS